MPEVIAPNTIVVTGDTGTQITIPALVMNREGVVCKVVSGRLWVEELDTGTVRLTMLESSELEVHMDEGIRLTLERNQNGYDQRDARLRRSEG